VLALGRHNANSSVHRSGSRVSGAGFEPTWRCLFAANDRNSREGRPRWRSDRPRIPAASARARVGQTNINGGLNNYGQAVIFVLQNALALGGLGTSREGGLLGHEKQSGPRAGEPWVALVFGRAQGGPDSRGGMSGPLRGRSATGNTSPPPVTADTETTMRRQPYGSKPSQSPRPQQAAY
jgi:hypothetical protein